MCHCIALVQVLCCMILPTHSEFMKCSFLPKQHKEFRHFVLSARSLKVRVSDQQTTENLPLIYLSNSCLVGLLIVIILYCICKFHTDPQIEKYLAGKWGVETMLGYCKNVQLFDFILSVTLLTYDFWHHINCSKHVVMKLGLL